MKKQVILLLKYGVGLGLLAWVIWRHWHIPGEDGREMGLSGLSERPFHVPFYVAALLIGALSVLVTFVRWHLLVRAQDLPFTLHSALRLGMVGFFFSTFLPGSVGGDLIKATFVAREQSRRTVAVATVLIDRVVGLCGLIWLTALIGLGFWGFGWLSDLTESARGLVILESIILGAAALMGGTLVFWVILGFLSGERSEVWAGRLERVPKIGGPLRELWRAVSLYRNRGRSVGLALALSMTGHFGFILLFYWASRSVNAPESIPTMLAHFLIVPVGNTIQAGIPTPGGVGGGEVAFEELYRMMGAVAGAGVLASLGARTINWILGLAGYLVYLRMKRVLTPATATGGNAPPDAADISRPTVSR